MAIQLPGREGRLAEPPMRDAADLVDALVHAIVAQIDRPYALFGHSMGSLLALETARALRRAGAPLPTHLYVSGRRAPQLSVDAPPLHRLPDEAFIAELDRRYGGLPAVIKAEPELLALFLPVLRADLALLERHTMVEEPPLPLPLTVFAGVDDRETPPERLTPWGDLVSGPFTMHTLPGGHFFLHEQRAAFMQLFTRLIDAPPVAA